MSRATLVGPDSFAVARIGALGEAEELALDPVIRDDYLDRLEIRDVLSVAS
jgi:hypothetical protein